MEFKVENIPYILTCLNLALTLACIYIFYNLALYKAELKIEMEQFIFHLREASIREKQRTQNGNNSDT